MGKKVTIQMVADLAGVSRGTVDRVLNNRSYVRADVRERVLDAIRDTGYVSPRESHQQQMDAAIKPIKLGVLMPNWDNQFLTEVTQGIRQAQLELADSHVQVISRKCKTDLAQEAIGLLEELRAEGVSGLAVCTLNDPSIEQRVSELAEAGIPCITFNSDLPGSRRLCFVGQDIRKAGRVAAGLISKRPGSSLFWAAARRVCCTEAALGGCDFSRRGCFSARTSSARRAGCAGLRAAAWRG